MKITIKLSPDFLHEHTDYLQNNFSVSIICKTKIKSSICLIFFFQFDFFYRLIIVSNYVESCLYTTSV